MSSKGRLALLLAGALAVRLLLLPLPEPFPADSSQFWQPWMAYGAEHGLVDLYRNGEPVVNYPPLYIALLVGLGKLHRLWTPTLAHTPWRHVLIKLPAVLADLAVATLLFAAAARRPGRDEAPATRRPTDALAIAALWAFNPAVIYVSAYWGQVDSIHTAWMLAALLAALGGRWFGAGLLLGLGLLTKLQAIVVLPLLLYLAWRPGWRALAQGGLGLAVALGAGLWPLRGALDAVWRVYAGSVGFYHRLTLNAYNLWWPPYNLGERLLGRQLTDDIQLLGPVTPRWIGLGLLAAYAALVAWALARGLRRQPASSLPESLAGAAGGVELVFLAAGLLVFGFFMLPTEIHERYILPALAFLALPAWRNRHLRPAYLLLTATVFLNLLEVLPFAAWFYRGLVALPGERLLISLVNLALFIWMTGRYWRIAHKGERLTWTGDTT